eukprot:986574-Rhodomonas_salina.2
MAGWYRPDDPALAGSCPPYCPTHSACDVVNAYRNAAERSHRTPMPLLEMSGTEPYAFAMGRPVSLCRCYGMSGTELGLPMTLLLNVWYGARPPYAAAMGCPALS